MDKEKPQITPNAIANIMYQAAKGDNKLPPLDHVCNDFPTGVTILCRDMFIQKANKTNKSIDKLTFGKIIRCIEKRYNTSASVLRSPAQDWQPKEEA